MVERVQRVVARDLEVEADAGRNAASAAAAALVERRDLKLP
jgi:hypothetical protein